VISKIDLAAATAFERDAAIANVHRVHPDLPIIEISARTGQGMEEWTEFLDRRIASKRALV
jgi:hydrogenase nickel incorporation protein HypB